MWDPRFGPEATGVQCDHYIIHANFVLYPQLPRFKQEGEAASSLLFSWKYSQMKSEARGPERGALRAPRHLQQRPPVLAAGKGVGGGSAVASRQVKPRHELDHVGQQRRGGGDDRRPREAPQAQARVLRRTAQP